MNSLLYETRNIREIFMRRLKDGHLVTVLLFMLHKFSKYNSADDANVRT